MKITFDEQDINRLTNIDTGEGVLIGLGNDPQLVFNWNGAFRPGWYCFHLHLEGNPGGVPELFFDMGHGFNQVERISLVPNSGGKSYKGLIKLPKKPDLVRLDPTDTNNAFVVKSLRANRISNPVVLAQGGIRLATVALSDPSRLGPMLNRAKELLVSDSIAGVNVRPVEKIKDPYSQWQATHDFLPDRDTSTYEATLARLSWKPKISVLMPVYNPDPEHLTAAIASVQAQLYDNWELCIADDASTKKSIPRLLKKLMAEDPRIRVRFRETNGHISQASNSALTLVTGDWIVPLDHDDLLRPHALAEVAIMINGNRDANFIYSDEDKINDAGVRLDPHFKPDFSPDLLRSMNYFNHLSAFRADLVKLLGGWREGFEGAQDYDLVLRVLDHVRNQGIHHIPKILYHWRVTEGSTAMAQGEKSYAWEAGQRALTDHLARNRIDAQVEPIETVPFYRTRYAITDPAPKVSLIIPTRDKVELLRVAVDSIFEKTQYDNFEVVIVDNGSEEAETHAYFNVLKAGSRPVRILDWDAPFNFSAINNFAVENCDADIVGLVNNDVEVIAGDWLREMVSWAQQSRIGCVGAKLYYPDNSIQHAGVIAGIGGVAGHSHKYYERGSHGYFSRLKVAQNVTAVTAACLLVRRDVYREVGGLDEKDLRVAFNDVDFCFKVLNAGYTNIWTPWAELYHHESKTRGAENTPEKRKRFEAEVRQMQARWPQLIDKDPYYNPNLTRDLEDFSLRP
ncbi:MAG: glycosyltransferase [Pseudomonadota bacterium]